MLEAAPLILGIAIAVGIFCLISFILIGCSIRIVDVLELGLEKNSNEQKVDEYLFRGGRYWVGLGHSFIKFPIPQMGIIFADWYNDEKAYSDSSRLESSINARTKEGLIITIAVTIQYKLGTCDDRDFVQKGEQLWDIYKNFELNWEDSVVTFVESVLRDVCCEYDAYDFFEKRAEVGKAMFNELATELYYFHFQLHSLKLMNLQFPTELEDAIQSTEIAKQNVLKYEKILDKEDIYRQTSTELAKLDRAIKEAEADSIALALSTIAPGEKLGKTYAIEKYAETFQHFKDNLQILQVGGMSDIDDYNEQIYESILTYMWIKIVEKHGSDLTFMKDLPASLKSS